MQDEHQKGHYFAPQQHHQDADVTACANMHTVKTAEVETCVPRTCAPESERSKIEASKGIPDANRCGRNSLPFNTLLQSLDRRSRNVNFVDDSGGATTKEPAPSPGRPDQATACNRSADVGCNKEFDDLKGNVLMSSLDPSGCRAVQHALTSLEPILAMELASELMGYVRKVLTSPHGNFVLQKIIQTQPTKFVQFIAVEIKESVHSCARHRYGCRIVCRLLEHCALHPVTHSLVDNLLVEAPTLSRHEFGHHVMECILEHSPVDQKMKIGTVLASDLGRHARNRYSSHVLEQALLLGPPDLQAILVAGLLDLEEVPLNADQPGNLKVTSPVPLKGAAFLAAHPSGIHIVRALLRLPAEHSEPVKQQLREVMPIIRTSKHGRRLSWDSIMANTEPREFDDQQDVPGMASDSGHENRYK